MALPPSTYPVLNVSQSTNYIAIYPNYRVYISLDNYRDGYLPTYTDKRIRIVTWKED